mmetsp:Transcript_150110/g.279829  ORF Transcript_150110/g.279829 Transcript_150110/m.279829 type:complete len:437 (+) Transcript_150110:130-1440(+)
MAWNAAARKAAPSMPESRCQIQLDMQLDPSSSKLLDELTATLRTAMASAASDRKTLLQKQEALVRENLDLEESNRRVSEEINALKAQLQEPRPPPPVHGNYVSDVAAEPVVADRGFVLERSIKIHDAPVHSVVMGPNSNFFATASWDATVRFYDFACEEVVKTFGKATPPGTDSAPGDMKGLYSVALAKTDSRILGCTSCDKNVYLWNCETNENFKVLKGHEDEVNGIDFHCEQQVMCTASDDKTAIIWDFMEGTVLRKLDKHTNAVYGATFLGKENQYLLATCCFDQKTRIFDLRDKKIVAEVNGHSDDVIGIDYSSEIGSLATGSDDGLVLVWDTRTWTQREQLNTKLLPGLESNEVKRVRWSKSGHQLAAACSSGCVLVYDMKNNGTPGAPTKLDGHTDCVFDVSWGTCPRTGAALLVSASHDHSCRYWRKAA